MANFLIFGKSAVPDQNTVWVGFWTCDLMSDMDLALLREQPLCARLIGVGGKAPKRRLGCKAERLFLPPTIKHGNCHLVVRNDAVDRGDLVRRLLVIDLPAHVWAGIVSVGTIERGRGFETNSYLNAVWLPVCDMAESVLCGFGPGSLRIRLPRTTLPFLPRCTRWRMVETGWQRRWG